MSTNARIGIKLEDGSILSAYHHWDGYPEWLGVILKQEYNTKEKVAELIDGGNMSSCWSDNEYDYEKQEFVKRDPQPEYYGGENERPRLSKNFTQFAFDSKSGEEFLYLFPENEWNGFQSITNMMMITTSWILKLFQLKSQIGMSQMTVN